MSVAAALITRKERRLAALDRSSDKRGSARAEKAHAANRYVRPGNQAHKVMHATRILAL
jgi:hypothetical protein